MVGISKSPVEPAAAVIPVDEVHDQDEGLLAFVAAAVAATYENQEQRRRRTWQRRGKFRETAFR